MTARTLATLQAAGRVALGGALTVAPGLVAGGWIGRRARERPAQTLAIAMGARDVAIALGTLQALRAGHGAAPWLRAGLAADAADLVATLRARDDLPPPAVPVVAAVAGGSIVLGAWLQAALD